MFQANRSFDVPRRTRWPRVGRDPAQSQSQLMTTTTATATATAVMLAMAIAMASAIGWAMTASAATGSFSTVMPRCKYSVRDVAFVNVHPATWQLLLIKPADQDQASVSQFSQWNVEVQQRLDRTNLEFMWVGAESEQAEKILALHNIAAKKIQSDPADETDLPILALQTPAGDLEPVDVRPGESLSAVLERLVTSPLRTQILQNACDALCVLLLIEGSDAAVNARAREVLESVKQQVESQMWSYDKQTQRGPQILCVPAQSQTNPEPPVGDANADPDAEQWLRQSLGVPLESSQPQVAVIYGQGRRMGDLIPAGDELRTEKSLQALQAQLIALCSICGRDCECDLDRNWLYGRQILQRWTIDLERAAEGSLNFDPHSAYVQAEVAQILQKPQREQAAGVDSALRLGGGLVIHDLDDLLIPPNLSQPSAAQNSAGNPSPDTSGSPASIAEENALLNDRSHFDSDIHSQEIAGQTTGLPPQKKLMERSEIEFESDVDEFSGAGVAVPWWAIIAGLVGLVIGAWLWLGKA